MAVQPQDGKFHWSCEEVQAGVDFIGVLLVVFRLDKASGGNAGNIALQKRQQNLATIWHAIRAQKRLPIFYLRLRC